MNFTFWGRSVKHLGSVCRTLDAGVGILFQLCSYSEENYQNDLMLTQLPSGVQVSPCITQSKRIPCKGHMTSVGQSTATPRLVHL